MADPREEEARVLIAELAAANARTADLQRRVEQMLLQSPAPSNPQFKALYDFAGRSIGQLSLVKGEIISVTEKDNRGWWLAKKSDGSSGRVPATYLEEVEATNEQGSPTQSIADQDPPPYYAPSGNASQFDDQQEPRARSTKMMLTSGASTKSALDSKPTPSERLRKLLVFSLAIDYDLQTRCQKLTYDDWTFFVRLGLRCKQVHPWHPNWYSPFPLHDWPDDRPDNEIQLGIINPATELGISPALAIRMLHNFIMSMAWNDRRLPHEQNLPAYRSAFLRRSIGMYSDQDVQQKLCIDRQLVAELDMSSELRRSLEAENQIYQNGECSALTHNWSHRSLPKSNGKVFVRLFNGKPTICAWGVQKSYDYVRDTLHIMNGSYEIRGLDPAIRLMMRLMRRRTTRKRYELCEADTRGLN